MEDVDERQDAQGAEDTRKGLGAQDEQPAPDGPGAEDGHKAPDGDGARDGLDADEAHKARDAAKEAAPEAVGLSDRDLAVLDLARRTWRRPGAKERAIRERLDISPTRYYQMLNALLDTPAALAHDPVTVNRLRRMRDARRSRR